MSKKWVQITALSGLLHYLTLSDLLFGLAARFVIQVPVVGVEIGGGVTLFRVGIRSGSSDNSILFLSLTLVTPRSGKEHAMADHMKNFGHSLESCPGLIQVHVMKEKGSSTLLGISMWESEDAFNSAMREVDVPPKVPIKSIRKDIQSRQFVDI